MNYYQLREIINEWDPINLLEIAPLDEYSYETSKIYDIICKEKVTIDVLANNIYQIFSESFGNVFLKSKKDCVAIANRIICLMSNGKG